MSKRVIGHGAMVGGRPTLSHRTRFYEECAAEFGDGERVCITVEKSTRNLRQNALYWVWCTLVGKERGWEKEYTHYLNKLTCNRTTVAIADPRTGEIKEDYYPGSTSVLSVDAFAEFMARVQRYWAEEGIDLPSSNDEEYTQ